MSDDEDFQYSDDDFDEGKHNKLVANVLSLNKVQNLKKPSRTEPTLQISEFNLVKSVTGKKGSVQVDELTKVLKTKKKHIQIGKRLESTNRKARTLPKPLEKPQSDRIRRSVGYEKNRFLFDRWEAFVSSNRAQAHQVFPLDNVERINVEAKEAIKLPETWKVKSELQKELEKLDQVEEYHIEDENDKDEFPLTLLELKAKRKEAAKLRAHQSFKEAKARKQNKIKSKKYHRILRKEKIKQKLKEFEELQKSNPEEALKKLEEIEKARALERFSLRHKSTGQWAKSKQFRAKYDKESRQVLAQQLQISRDLTQKLKHGGSDSEEEDLETEKTTNTYVQNDGNPWINGPKPDKEVSEFISGYKRFWSDHNKNEEKNEIEKSITKKVQGSDLEDIEENSETEEKLDDISENKIPDDIQQVKKKIKKKKKETSKSKPSKKQNNIKKIKENEEQPPSKKKKTSLHTPSGEWNIDDIFNHAERKVEEKLKKKLKKDQKTLKVKSNKPSKKARVKELNKIKQIYLSIPSQRKKQIIDEEMVETPLNEDDSNVDKNYNVEKLKNILGEEGLSTSKKVTSGKAQSQDIDPEKFMKPKTTNLDSALPDLMVEDENSEENTQKNIIMEAFEDNDIVQDFNKEKQEELEKDKPKDIDLNLPGWGSWAGTGIDPKKQRKRRRFIVRMPEVMPRRDDNKGTLIINEKAAAKVKHHLVSEVPFPFKTVKDYEASIRSPIGNTFVPEIAFRKFIRPAVETKMGTIIEPVTTSILMGKTKR